MQPRMEKDPSQLHALVSSQGEEGTCWHATATATRERKSAKGTQEMRQYKRRHAMAAVAASHYCSRHPPIIVAPCNQNHSLSTKRAAPPYLLSLRLIHEQNSWECWRSRLEEEHAGAGQGPDRDGRVVAGSSGVQVDCALSQFALSSATSGHTLQLQTSEGPPSLRAALVCRCL
ncbi:hypothetical protein D4764_20G0005320 [Takifugu flavidus]|uniref:Uncharacterized protein n=1 Tax=Takifugu flavidus TaxID=433684 RepID=A0A5C6NK92_9TELE|nr:hypothetical protein D4764_20G0005320 [Takifugu flavidus]